MWRCGRLQRSTSACVRVLRSLNSSCINVKGTNSSKTPTLQNAVCIQYILDIMPYITASPALNLNIITRFIDSLLPAQGSMPYTTNNKWILFIYKGITSSEKQLCSAVRGSYTQEWLCCKPNQSVDPTDPVRAFAVIKYSKNQFLILR